MYLLSTNFILVTIKEKKALLFDASGHVSEHDGLILPQACQVVARSTASLTSDCSYVVLLDANKQFTILQCISDSIERVMHTFDFEFVNDQVR